MVPDFLSWLAIGGTAVFAASGALLALRKEMDIIGIIFVAMVTGVGGGTIRDLLLGETPVSWVKAPVDIVTCIAAALIVSLLNAKLAGKRMQWLLYADAVGLALFSVLGAHKAELAGAHWLVVALFGAVSASFGGVIRDIICNELPVVFRGGVYVTAALLGALVFIILPDGLGIEIRSLIAAAAALVLRLVAIRKDWSLPFPRYVRKD